MSHFVSRLRLLCNPRQVVPQGVAATAGLDKGDIILRVNDISFENSTHEEAVGYLKVGNLMFAGVL